jgi:hypothetical protein
MIGHLDSDSFDQAVPVCAMEKADFVAFTAASYFTAATVTSIDTTNIPMYRDQDERIPEPRITYLTVEEPWKPGGPNGYAFPMPAKTATFGPTAAAATEDELVEAVFVSACRSDEYEACAVNCWAPVASGALVPFTQSLTGKIALFASAEDEDEDEDEDDSDYGCFPTFSSWAKLAQDAGAVAIVHGTRADVSSWYYAGPYQVPFDLTIPFFSLMRPHTELLEHARDESAAHGSHDVTLQTPVLAGGAGPDFFADADVDFGLAPVLVWRDDTDHFYCDAGQAVFNPAPWAGLPLPSTGNRLVTVFPSDACAAASGRRRRVRPVHGGRRVHADRAALGASRRRCPWRSTRPRQWTASRWRSRRTSLPTRAPRSARTSSPSCSWRTSRASRRTRSTPPSGKPRARARRCLLSPTRRTSRGTCMPSWTSPTASLCAAPRPSSR